MWWNKIRRASRATKQITCFMWRRNSFILGEYQRSFTSHHRFSFCVPARQPELNGPDRLSNPALTAAQRKRRECDFAYYERDYLHRKLEMSSQKLRRKKLRKAKDKGYSFNFSLVFRKALVTYPYPASHIQYIFGLPTYTSVFTLLDPHLASLPVSLCTQRFPAASPSFLSPGITSSTKT